MNINYTRNSLLTHNNLHRTSHFFPRFLSNEEMHQVSQISTLFRNVVDLRHAIITGLGSEQIDESVELVYSLNLPSTTIHKAIKALKAIPIEERRYFVYQVRSLNLPSIVIGSAMLRISKFPILQRDRFINHLRTFKFSKYSDLADVGEAIMDLSELYEKQIGFAADVLSLGLPPQAFSKGVKILEELPPTERAHFVEQICSLKIEIGVVDCMHHLRTLSFLDRAQFVEQFCALQLPRQSRTSKILEELLWIPSRERANFITQLQTLNIKGDRFLELFSNLSDTGRRLFIEHCVSGNIPEKEQFAEIQAFTANWGNNEEEELTELFAPLYVYPSQLSNDPTTVLNRFQKKLHLQNAYPFINYHDSPAVDAGGVTKDFTTELFNALFAPVPRLPLKTITSTGNGPLPMMENDNQGACYRGIGYIFGVALLEHCQIQIGSRFSPSLYAMLHVLSWEELRNLPKIRNASSIPPQVIQKLQKVYLKANCSSYFGEKLTEEDLDSAIDALVDRNEPNQYLQEVFSIQNLQELLAEEKITQILHAACFIAAGIAETMSRQGWNRRKGATSIDLMKKIEGELTKEKTLEILKENQDSLARAYLIQWVEEADDAQLQKLIFAITGSNSLNEDLVIDLKELPANGSLPLPIYHTCFNTIELYNYPTFEIFKSKLEDSLANVTGSGLTIA